MGAAAITWPGATVAVVGSTGWRSRTSSRTRVRRRLDPSSISRPSSALTAPASRILWTPSASCLACAQRTSAARSSRTSSTPSTTATRRLRDAGRPSASSTANPTRRSSTSPAPSPAQAAVSTASTAALSPGTSITPSSDPSASSSRPAISSSSRSLHLLPSSLYMPLIIRFLGRLTICAAG